MDKGLTVQKWVLINWTTKPQCPKKLSAQIVCPSPEVKVLNFDEKRLHWASGVSANNHWAVSLENLYVAIGNNMFY